MSSSSLPGRKPEQPTRAFGKMPLLGGISLHALETFCFRIGMGLRSGVDILKLFESEASRGSAKHRETMSSIRTKLAAGDSLASAMSAVAPYFPPLLVQMVSAGETSGGLERILTHMGNHYQALRAARRNFLGQIAWPVIQAVIAIAVVCLVIALRGFIATVPGEVEYDPIGLGLAGTGGVITFLGCVALFVFTLIALGFGIWKNVFQCHRWLVPLVLPVPILGDVLSNLALSRMTMTLSMLLNAGVEAVRSVRDAFLSTNNDYYIQGMPAALDAVRQGQSLAVSFEQAHKFPREFIEAIEVGELSGNETESLEHLANEYSRRATTALTQLSTLAGFAIWGMISIFIIYMILKMAMQYVNMLNSFM